MRRITFTENQTASQTVNGITVTSANYVVLSNDQNLVYWREKNDC